jgi:hypothetical protein
MDPFITRTAPIDLTLMRRGYAVAGLAIGVG